MIRRLSISLLTIVAMVSGGNIVCQAQEQFPLTRHTREVTQWLGAVGGAAPRNTVHFDLVLALRNQPELENFLHDLYDPSNPSYRRFLPVQEFTARFGPSQAIMTP